MNARRLSTIIALGLFGALSQAQVPDLLNALDSGGRAMGAGGSLYGTTSDTLSSAFNPAGTAFVDTPAVGVALRNLPRSNTTISGNTLNPDFNVSGKRGNLSPTHLGYVKPLGKRGVLSLTLTTEGYLNDVLNGSTSNGAVTITRNLRREVRTDFLTLSLARTREDQLFSWGFGLQVAQTGLRYNLNQVDNLGGSIVRNENSTSYGVGAIIGAQFTPKGNQNVSFGLSYRTEINLVNNSRTSDLLDRIPARLLGSMAYRIDGFRGGKDFLIVGTQIQTFFNAKNGPDFNRKTQVVGGLGLEYNLVRDTMRIPVRLGYNIIPSGGNGFGPRNAFTFGIGYRPNNAKYTIDLNFAYPETGGPDFGLFFNYRFGK